MYLACNIVKYAIMRKGLKTHRYNQRDIIGLFRETENTIERVQRRKI